MFRKKKKGERVVEHMRVLEQLALAAMPKVAVCVHGKCETCSYKASCARYHSKKGRL